MSQNQKYQAWFEKHRPRTIDDLVFPTVLNGEGKDPEYIKEIFKKFYNQEFVQGNVLSYGPGGFGKTSLKLIVDNWTLLACLLDIKKRLNNQPMNKE